MYFTSIQLLASDLLIKMFFLFCEVLFYIFHFIFLAESQWHENYKTAYSEPIKESTKKHLQPVLKDMYTFYYIVKQRFFNLMRILKEKDKNNNLTLV